jgi:dethiobiotin synthetase
MPRLTILGTDTDAGKTYVSTALVRALRDRGVSLAPYKPLASGAPRGEGDPGALAEASGLPHDLITPWCFERPVSPAFELERLGSPASPAWRSEQGTLPWPGTAELLRRAREVEARGHALLIETAGGLASPVTPTLDSWAIARVMGGSSLLVALNRLGCIAALGAALHQLASHRHRLLGVVLNDGAAESTPERDRLLDENEDWLRHLHRDVVWFRLRREGALPTALVDRVASRLRPVAPDRA